MCTKARSVNHECHCVSKCKTCACSSSAAEPVTTINEPVIKWGRVPRPADRESFTDDYRE